MAPGDAPVPDRPRLRRRAVAVMVTGAVTLVGGLGAVLGGGDVMAAVTARFPGHAPPARSADAPGSAEASATGALDPVKVAGHWRGPDGALLIVTPRGAVWSDRGALQGAALPVPLHANFAFGTARFRCAYAVRFTSADTAEWRLIDGAGQAPCPEGAFKRPPTL